MKLHSPIPHRKARIEIIPLIDIMFFLLASFMLVSMSMIRLSGVKMSLPQAATATPETKPDFIPISVSPTGDIFFEKDKQPIALDQLTGLLKPLYAANPELRVYINADRDASHGMVIDVLDRVRQAGVGKVSFAIKPGGAAVPAPPSAPVAPGASAVPPAAAAPSAPSAPAAPAAPIAPAAPTAPAAPGAKPNP